MAKKRKLTFEYRHYELPQDLPVLALLGDSWIRKYELLDALHFHNHMEIGYCHWGTGSLYIEDRTYSFGPGTFTMIPQNVPHSTSSDIGTMSKWEYLFVDLNGLTQCLNGTTGRYAQSVMEQINTRAFYLNESDHPEMAGMVLKIMDDMRYHKHHYHLSVRGMMIALLMEAGRLEEMADAIEVVPHNKSSIQVAPALEYISINYYKPIKIVELAELCHMSETHFRRLFQHIMSVSPLDYINTVRIHNACALLRSTQDSVLSIAIKTGYSTITTFNRNFYKMMETTPLKWRNNPVNMEKSLKNYNIKRLEGWF